jgi:hypothetical protein
MISEISSLNRAAALATIHSRVSLAFDPNLFLLLLDCDTVWFRSAAGLPKYVAQAALKNLIFPSGSFVMVGTRSLSA